MEHKSTSTQHKDVYSIVNERIIELLEKGVIPWRQPWTDSGLPSNLITGKPYRGINVMLLTSLGYSQNYFLSFNQAKDLGASIKKGEKPMIVVFWKWLEKENEKTNKIEKIPLLRYYRVFNIDQCTGIPIEKIPAIIERENNPIETCEKIIKEMPKRPKIKHEKQQAYYEKLNDYVNMPKIETFKSSEDYYGTLFHELMHSTGHTERLNRKELVQNNKFGTKDYAIEELTAEIGACYLKSHSGIPIEQMENNASYIKGWLAKLKNDKKLIIHASTQAQKATDYILNIRNEEKELDVKQPTKSVEREKELIEIRENRTSISHEQSR